MSPVFFEERTGLFYFGFWIVAAMRYIGFVLLVVFALACHVRDVAPVDVATREVRDDLDRTLAVPEKIERAISLAPSVTEMIFAIGAGDRLVGVTTYCDHPPAAAKIEKVGDTQTPNIEKIIALRPQIVFVSTASQLEAFTRTLDEQGIAVYVTDSASLDDMFDDLRKFGELFGTENYAEGVIISLLGRATRARDQAHADGGRQRKPRVFVQISNEPLFTIGRDSFLTELVEQAGGISVTKDVPTAYPTLSKETAAALDPDVIILSDSGDNLEPTTVLKNSSAVRSGRVYRINADILSRPGPRLVDALEQISARLREQG